MVLRRFRKEVVLAGFAAEAKAPMMMGNKTELAATVCATILRLAHELAREWICLQAAVAFLTRTALATAAIKRGV